VAAWLEAHAGERLGEYLGLIAGHYELAGERAKAAEYLRRSGEEAHRVSSFRDAAATFERALSLLPKDVKVERAALLVMSGQAQISLGEYGEAARQFGDGLELARDAGERVTEVAALNGLGEVAWRQGDWEAARGHLHEALALAQACEDTGGQALAAQHLARISWLSADYDQAERWAQQSQGWYEQVGDRQGLIAARNELGVAAFHRAEFDRAQDHFGANLALAREMDDRYRIQQALNNLGEVAREQGAYDQARAYYEQSRTICEEIGDRLGVALTLGNLGMVCVAGGQDVEAWQYVRQSLPEHMAMQDMPHVLTDLVSAAHLQARAGKPQRAAELLGLALHHPASYSEVDRDAQPVLELLREALGEEALEAALSRGAELELEQVLAEILADQSQD
jgi:tetratricopeptide (TPR) repeat protein